MENLFNLLDFEFAKCKNKQWVSDNIEEINNAITNKFFCICVNYKYMDFNSIDTIIFENKEEMSRFKKIESCSSSKWVSKLFFSDKIEITRNMDF